MIGLSHAVLASKFSKSINTSVFIRFSESFPPTRTIPSYSLILMCVDFVQFVRNNTIPLPCVFCNLSSQSNSIILPSLFRCFHFPMAPFSIIFQRLKLCHRNPVFAAVSNCLRRSAFTTSSALRILYAAPSNKSTVGRTNASFPVGLWGWSSRNDYSHKNRVIFVSFILALEGTKI